MPKVRKQSVSSKHDAEESSSEDKMLTRRLLLKNTAGAIVGAAAAGLTGAIGARAQVQGLYTYNAPPEFPLAMRSLTYLDQKQYIHNMDIVAHLPRSTISGGEPLMAMWAKGKQRLLPAAGGFVGVSHAQKTGVMNKRGVLGGGTGTSNKKLKKWIMRCTAAQPLSGADPE